MADLPCSIRPVSMKQRKRRSTVMAGILALALAAANCSPILLPSLVASVPAGGGMVARTAWLVLDFSGPVDATAMNRIMLTCNGAGVYATPSMLDSDTVVVAPNAPMPASAACQLWLGTTGGNTLVAFQTAAAGPAFSAVHDRRDPDQPLPFPDDFMTVADASKATGLRPSLTLPNAPGTMISLIEAVANTAETKSDGWSPVGHLAVQISEAVDPASVPTDRDASMDPLSTVALLDLTPSSPSFGARVPFQLFPRSPTIPGEPISHALLMSPGIALEPEGVYGLVVTDRVLDAAGEPLGRSSFGAAVSGPLVPGEDSEITRARDLAEDVLSVAETLSPVPIPRDDVVLAVRLTIRSTDQFADDPLAMRQDVLVTPPNVVITSVTPDYHSDVAAIVEGTFDAPAWLSALYIQRDAQGVPLANGTESVPFVLALPASAAAGIPAPIIMYQHGNPGNAEWEVPSSGRRFGGDGFAVAGFTDPINRALPDLGFQQQVIFGNVILNGEAPEFYLTTYGEQMAFVSALKSMGSLDVLPIGAPDGIPDLDPTTLVYEGISYGSAHGQAFLAYEPEIAAAGLVVGALRFAEMLEHQDRTLPHGGDPFLTVLLPSILTGMRAPDMWMTLHLFAVSYDPQDAHNHARFIYRQPVLVDGTTQKASILVVEGIDDGFVPNNSTRSLARQLGGIPQLVPDVVRISDLPEQAGPIQANVDATTTSAMVQYAPAGAAVPPSPGCIGQFEGHYCAQSAPAAVSQRTNFYQSAQVGVPVIDE
ncbi:MAG: hypothetical protein GY946_22290 [bacterium]|nr:hypothetical protein [bacterium]